MASDDVPEIISLPILAGTPDYLDWMRTETRAAEAHGLNHAR
ncbi:divalent cation tolerance protein CutA [Promicromonospora kroppenstedtii]|nr:divalent cation tolerance protein CutA [Promicromonospora kroppenstedtii]